MIRYTEMPKDRAEFFALTMKALVAQGGPSIVAEGPNRGACEYRSQDGRACAVGFWLSDEEAEACFERSAEAVYEDSEYGEYGKLPRIFAVFTADPKALTYIQGVHDQAALNSGVDFRQPYEPSAWHNALWRGVQEADNGEGYVAEAGAALLAALKEWEAEQCPTT